MAANGPKSVRALVNMSDATTGVIFEVGASSEISALHNTLII